MRRPLRASACRRKTGLAMLAIATQDPGSVAETYVRQHLRLILPGRTVGIALEPGASASGTTPFCLLPTRQRNSVVRRAELLSALIRTGYSGGPSWTDAKGIAAFLRKHGVRAVLAEFGTTGIALQRLCSSLRLKLIVNFHGYDATVLPRRHDIRRAYRTLARNADGFVCGSRHFKRTLIDIGFPEEVIHIVPCGIEVADFDASSDRDGAKVLMVGRLTEKKRPDLAIHAFAEVLRTKSDLRLEIIGDGPFRPTCEAAIREHRLEDAITLHGELSHAAVRGHLAEASFFMQHSMTAANGDQESQGISLLEAMASGLPVVATDHNGFSETVLHDVSGLLSPEGDCHAMAANLTRLACNRDLSRAMGRAGRHRVETHFGAQDMAGRLRALLFPRDDLTGILKESIT